MTSSQSELEIESGCQTTLQRRSKDLERKRWPWIKSARKKTVLLEMKTSTSLTLLLLTVLTCVRSEEFTGYEGGAVVINCPYEKGYESYPKYLVKGGYKDGVELIRSTSRSDWTHKERFSLQDKKNRNMFSVTIRQLTLKDAGTYFCGVDTWGSDFYTLVNLKVVKPTTAAIPLPFTKVTKEVTTVALTHTPVATHNTITESERTTDFQSEPTTASSGSHVANLSGGLGAAVVLISLLLVTSVLIKRRAKRRRASLTTLSGITRTETADYENDPHGSSTIQMSSVYQSLNPNTTQPDAVYQSLNANTTQPDAVYQSLNPNTTQPDAVYQSLNPNTTQPDAVYQSLNPNTTQPDAVYQSLNPNTIQPDPVYQGLNVND